MEYIKWLSLNDLALGIQLKRMDEILKDYVEEKRQTTIKESLKKFKGIVGKYFNTLCKDEFNSIYNGLSREYRKLFWEAFGLYKLFEKTELNLIPIY